MVKITNKNSLLKTKFSISDDGFSYRGQHYLFDEVLSLTRFARNTLTTFVAAGQQTTHEISIRIQLMSGEMLLVSEKTTLFHESKIDIATKINEYFNHLEQNTLDFRLQRYNDQIEKKGSFNLGKYTISTKDRTITSHKTNVTFKIADLSFSRRYGSIIFQPKNYAPTLFIKLMRHFFGRYQPDELFTLKDEDIIFDLLRVHCGIAWR